MGIPAVIAEETDIGLNAGLQRSDADALLQEQKNLQEALLHSKAVGSANQIDRLVLLCFTRCPRELIDALLESHLARRLAAEGVQLQPHWAGGRLIFAAGATEAAFSEVTKP